MPVAFLSRPDRPRARAMPHLAAIEPDRPPQLLVARATTVDEIGTLRERLNLSGDGVPGTVPAP